MTIQEIQTRKEDQTFDCKSIQIEPKALAIPIVAFANADGGVIAIGVSDKTRKIEGIDHILTNSMNYLVYRSTSVTRPFPSLALMCFVRIKTETKTAFY